MYMQIIVFYIVANNHPPVARYSSGWGVLSNDSGVNNALLEFAVVPSSRNLFVVEVPKIWIHFE